MPVNGDSNPRHALLQNIKVCARLFRKSARIENLLKIAIRRKVKIKRQKNQFQVACYLSSSHPYHQINPQEKKGKTSFYSKWKLPDDPCIQKKINEIRKNGRKKINGYRRSQVIWPILTEKETNLKFIWTIFFPKQMWKNRHSRSILALNKVCCWIAINTACRLVYKTLSRPRPEY